MTRIDDLQDVPDWLLGGRVRRRVLERLVERRGWTAKELATEINASEPVVYETFRALKEPLNALEPVGTGAARYRLRRGNAVADAIRKMVTASRDFTNKPVSRPPSRSKRRR